MWENVSSAFPEKKSSLPRNFCSSSRILGIWKSPIKKGTTFDFPLEILTDQHLEGFSIIPIDIILSLMSLMSL